MTVKTVFAALALTLAPVLAAAQGCNYDKIEQTSSCAQGFTWDAAAQTCVPVVSS